MLEEDVDFLAHFGVKGMRWGVRNAAYKEAASGINAASPEVQRRQAAKRANVSLTEDDFKQLSSKDVVIKKGSLVNRTTRTPNHDVATDRLYLSTNSKDAAAYRAVVPTWSSPTGKVERKYKEVYDVTFRATNDLKSPSEKARVKAYIELMDQPKIQLSSGQQITGRQYLERQGLGTTISQLSSREVALQYYGQLTVAQGIRNDPINTAYFKSLSDKGYNALVDDNDRGVIAQTPLLALRSHKDLELVEVRPLTTTQIHEAQKSLRLP